MLRRLTSRSDQPPKATTDFSAEAYRLSGQRTRAPDPDHRATCGLADLSQLGIPKRVGLTHQRDLT
ncbi:MAG: hypothetical protein CM15mP92_1610 [Halieaceae bacterium]|nr:MAG: hypothetical protein CM15mP92_1610 [Halieaceae bacterium]